MFQQVGAAAANGQVWVRPGCLADEAAGDGASLHLTAEVPTGGDAPHGIGEKRDLVADIGLILPLRTLPFCLWCYLCSHFRITVSVSKSRPLIHSE